MLFDESHMPSPIQFGVPAQDAEQSPFSSFCKTPHDIDAHGVLENASYRLTSLSTHQPRSWSKAEASLKIVCILVTLSILQSLRSWSKAEAPLNICCMSVTLSTAQPLMSWLKADARWNIASIFMTL